MGRKYLGDHFDIHGGGMDLVFPHHECEIAQAVASQGDQMVHYWMHNNMITIDGKKMGKSYNNFITLPQFFAGEHEKLSQPYSPMTIRFFILQAHYRSTVDFGNEALQAAEKGLARLMDGWKTLKRLADGQKVKGQPQIEMAYVDELRTKCYEAMNDDLASPLVISHLFDACRVGVIISIAVDFFVIIKRNTNKRGNQSGNKCGKKNRAKNLFIFGFIFKNDKEKDKPDEAHASHNEQRD
jgi:cysteinyl-tRNA synthetase